MIKGWLKKALYAYLYNAALQPGSRSSSPNFIKFPLGSGWTEKIVCVYNYIYMCISGCRIFFLIKFGGNNLVIMVIRSTKSHQCNHLFTLSKGDVRSLVFGEGCIYIMLILHIYKYLNFFFFNVGIAALRGRVSANCIWWRLSMRIELIVAPLVKGTSKLTSLVLSLNQELWVLQVFYHYVPSSDSQFLCTKTRFLGEGIFVVTNQWMNQSAWLFIFDFAIIQFMLWSVCALSLPPSPHI